MDEDARECTRKSGVEMSREHGEGETQLPLSTRVKVFRNDGHV